MPSSLAAHVTWLLPVISPSRWMDGFGRQPVIFAFFRCPQTYGNHIYMHHITAQSLDALRMQKARRSSYGNLSVTKPVKTLGTRFGAIADKRGCFSSEIGGRRSASLIGGILGETKVLLLSCFQDPGNERKVGFYIDLKASSG